ncbi:transporter associated domain-containing protein [Aeoliella mucimassa]|uniref:Magnesium and cobalt efflux protein CorC n=1 Tax=Aeoliella mucimassa TaxID=2527972 RepID=A0A518ATE7_9BACT|nr:transporter associated domain-containing protein [Aeoliella mucimassa]QDU57985.1 Magnesium and cobalt efflux protein CorC [Aeoliella mucimassa]
MTLDPLLWVAIVSGALVCFFSIGTRVLRGFSRHDLRELCEARNDVDLFSEVLRSHDRVALGLDMLVVLATTTFIVSCAAFAWTEPHISLPRTWPSVVGEALVLGLILTGIRVAVPWTTSRLFSAHLLYYCWPLFNFLALVASPVVGFARLLDTILHRVFGRTAPQLDEESLEEEIRTIVSEGHREGLLEGEAREMIEGVIELADADVAEIMTPRTDMHMVQLDLPWDALLADVISSGHTRIPVYDTNRDDIIGVLYSKDLLPELTRPGDEQPRPVQDIVRKPLFVPETKAVDDLLKMFQQERTHIAIVLDEYGGVAGLVTIEDVLEEIVGEIVDEYDEDVEEVIEQKAEDIFEAAGRAHVDEINSAMSIELPEDGDFDTIGGFVFTEFGRVPSVGESLLWDEVLKITVLEATRRRIDRVRLERLPSSSRESA